SSFSQQPSPPRLPKEEQERFEQLLRDSQSAGAFAVPRSPSSDSSSSAERDPEKIDETEGGGGTSVTLEELKAKIAARGDGEELHPNVRRGAAPEFEGDVNPKTGEVGGPKNEPLRWGKDGDWSYNGRVTDF
ncbi:DUF1674 domain-containing protein, partial [Rhizodiscina lignyota]